MMLMTVQLKDGQALSMQMPTRPDKAYELAAQISLLASVDHVDVPSVQRFIDGEKASSRAIKPHDYGTLNL